MAREDLERGADPGWPEATTPVWSPGPPPVPRGPVTDVWPPVGVPVPSSWDGRGLPPPSGPVPVVQPPVDLTKRGAPAGWGPPPPAPASRGGRGRGVLIGVLAASLVVGGGVAAWSGLAGDDAPSPPVAASEPVDPAEGVDKGIEHGGAAPSSAPAPAPATPTASPEEQALAELESLREESRASLALDGRWVAQVASKNVGITDPLQTTATGSHQFFAVDILAESRSLLSLAADSQVHVLTSFDFGRRSAAANGDLFWITIVDAGFGSGDDVRAWCAGAFPQLSGDALANACVARTLEPPHD
ncbi:hypothetical protein [Geodermatophilus sp. SYSU D00698]